MIPKKIHYIWFGGEKTEKVKKCVASWEKYMPDYEIIEWNENNIDIDKERRKSKFFKLCYDKKNWGVLTDYIRTDILFNHGGIYLDADVEVIKRFDDLLDNKLFLGYQNEEELCYAVVGAEKGHEFIAAMQKFYKEEVMKSQLYISTHIIKYIMNKVYSKEYDFIRNGISFYPQEYFYPYSWEEKFTKECITEKTYAIHHWDGSWLSNKSRMHLEYKNLHRIKRNIYFWIDKLKK